MTKNKVFLLGGYDLEMLEIKKLLLQKGIDPKALFDKKLSWGASLSAYSDIIEIYANQPEYSIVSIELTPDIPPPSNYHTIDHHNDLIHLTSSIEQIAQLLGVELNRWQQLVAVNDVGHIKAMRDFGASENEINEIRKADRKAQGVTDEEEKQAVEDIKQATVENRVLVIKTSINHFSAITDRITTEKLLVYNQNKLCYYGIGATTFIKDEFKQLIQVGKAYYGGKGGGYFGVVENSLSPTEMQDILQKIIMK